MARISAIARDVLREARFNRLAWVALALVLVGLGLGAFAGRLALTETRETQGILVAATLRLLGVLVMLAFITASLLRERQDRVLQFLMALPMPRWQYLAGKQLGFLFLALPLALVLGSALLPYAPATAVVLWSASLACELLIASALALLCAITFNHQVIALTGATAIYLLARSLAEFMQMAQHALLPESAANLFMKGALATLGLLLPDLSQFTRGDWLAYGTGTPAMLLPLLGQTGAFLGLALVVACIDFQRRPL